MNDRLGDLPAWAMENEGEDTFDDEGPHEQALPIGKGGDVEMGEAPKQPKHMEYFFREVDSIKDDIEAVKSATRSIGGFNEAVMQATTTEEENEVSRKVRPLVDETNKRAKRTKNLIGLLKEETKQLEDESKIKQSDLRYDAKE